MKKRKFAGFIFGLLTVVLVIVGFCMCFTNEFLITQISTSLGSVKIDTGGLSVVFGGTHPYYLTIDTIIGSTTTKVDYEYSFNIVAFLAFILPLCGGMLSFIASLFKSKGTFLNLLGIATQIVGVVLLFFVIPSFKNVYDGQDPSTTFGTTFIIAIVCFALALLTSVAKLVFVDLKK